MASVVGAEVADSGRQSSKSPLDDDGGAPAVVLSDSTVVPEMYSSSRASDVAHSPASTLLVNVATAAGVGPSVGRRDAAGGHTNCTAASR